MDNIPKRSVCSTIECYSTAVTRCISTGRNHCLVCTLKLVKAFGPEDIVSLAGMKLPWEDEDLIECLHCHHKYSRYLVGLTGECPRCRKPLPKEVLECQK